MKLNEKHLTALVQNDVEATRKGFLHKRGELNRAFQKRWFVLKGNLLFYFEKPTDSDPIGVIILESYKVESNYDTEPGLHAFDIAFSGSGSRRYTLAAENREDMKRWKKDILRASYEHMSEMVKELQKQMDDINAAREEEASKRLKPAPRTVAEASRSLLRESHVASEQLVDLSAATAETNNKIAKRRARINPFDLEASSTFYDLAPEVTVDGASRGQNSARSFFDLHRKIGEDICKRCDFS